MQGSQQQPEFMPGAIALLAARGSTVPFARKDGGEAAADDGIREESSERATAQTANLSN